MGTRQFDGKTHTTCAIASYLGGARLSLSTFRSGDLTDKYREEAGTRI